MGKPRAASGGVAVVVRSELGLRRPPQAASRHHPAHLTRRRRQDQWQMPQEVVCYLVGSKRGWLPSTSAQGGRAWCHQCPCALPSKGVPHSGGLSPRTTGLDPVRARFRVTDWAVQVVGLDPPNSWSRARVPLYLMHTRHLLVQPIAPRVVLRHRLSTVLVRLARACVPPCPTQCPRPLTYSCHWRPLAT